LAAACGGVGSTAAASVRGVPAKQKPTSTQFEKSGSARAPSVLAQSSQL